MNRHSEHDLRAELEAAGAIFKGSKILCPFHEDKNPSGGIYEKTEVFRYKCQACGAGGDAFDIRSLRTGRPLPEILKDNAQDRPQAAKRKAPAPKPPKIFDSLQAIYGLLKSKHGGQLEALHKYTDSTGGHIQFVIRWRGSDGKKQILPSVQTEKGLELRAPQNRKLYHLPDLAQAETVIVAEGEHKADILTGYGFTVSTSAGGSKAASKTDWRPLAGKDCIIWRDNDPAGLGYQNEVKRILEGLGARVKLIDPAALDLAEGEDCADYIQQLKNAGYSELEIKQNLDRVFSQAKSTGPGAELQTHLADIGAGRMEALETGFSQLDDLLQILPGSLNLVCGGPGASKSLLMLQLAAIWHKAGIKTAVFEIEKDRVFHLRRALAQQAGLAMLTNNRWTRNNAEQARAAAIEHCDFLDSFGGSIYAFPEKIIYQKDVIQWTQARADAGCRAVVIDPATKAERRADPWKADGEFVQGLQRIATLTRLIIFIVLHPAKSIVAMPDLSAIAGGASYSRFCDNAIWLANHEAKESEIHYCTGTTSAEHNRTIWILKSRDGSGTGARIAFDFSADSLTLSELGRIQKTKRKK